MTESKRAETQGDALTFAVVLMWIGSAMIGSDMVFGTWLTAGPTMILPILCAIWVFVVAIWRLQFGYLIVGLSSLILPLICFVAKGCVV